MATLLDLAKSMVRGMYDDARAARLPAGRENLMATVVWQEKASELATMIPGCVLDQLGLRPKTAALAILSEAADQVGLPIIEAYKDPATQPADYPGQRGTHLCQTARKI